MKTKKRILVVDDEVMLKMLLKKILIEEGYAVFCVNSGRAAIKNIKRKKFDLVLLDLEMPGIDGIKTLEIIRKINRNLPVILLSAHLTNDSIKKAVKLEVSNYIEKSFKLDEMKFAVKKVLKRR